MSIRKNGQIIGGAPAVDAELSDASANPIQNRAVKKALDRKADLVSGKIPSAQLPSMDYIPNDAKGAANGVASLDSAGKVPDSQLSSSAINAIESITVNGTPATVTNKVAAINVPTDSDYIPQTEKGAANGVAPLDGNSLVPDENLPALAPLPLHLNAAPTTSTVGVFGQHAIVDSTGKEYTCVAVTTADDVTTYTWCDVINEKGGTFSGFVRFNSNARFSGLNVEFSTTGLSGVIGRYSNKDQFSLNAGNTHIFDVTNNGNLYILNDVQQGITVIPASTTSYTLTEGCFSHAPSEASTYTFPAVTDTTRTHQIRLTLDFTTVQTYAFQDSQGTAITPLFTPTIAAGDVYEFRCEYSAVQSRWLIYPCKQGAVSDDYVMQAEVGAANGVAGLDSSSLVPVANLPKAAAGSGDNIKYGVVAISSSNDGLVIDNSGPTAGCMRLNTANNTMIDTRSISYRNPIVPSNLNYAVTAALTDAKHITLTSEQQATAQSVIGIDAPVVFTTAGEAPTTSTVGTPGRRAVNTADGKAWTCTAITNTGTEAEPVWSYTWTDDINANGGTLQATLYFGNTSNLVKQNNIVIGGGNHGSIGYFACGIGEGVKPSGISVVCLGWDATATIQGELALSSHDVISFQDKGIENASYNNGIFKSVTYQQFITEIPSATTTYTLQDGCYIHIPENASIYTLFGTMEIVTYNRYFERYPAKDGETYYGWYCRNNDSYRYTSTPTPTTSDFTYTNTELTSGKQAITAIDNRTHECVLDVKFDNVQTLVFQDADGNVIEPQDDIDIQQGDVWRFLCQWSSLQSQWQIMPIHMGRHSTPTPSPTPTGGLTAAQAKRIALIYG